MTRQQATFLLTGLIAGIITVLVGRAWSEFLVVGVGVVFCCAVLVAISITGSWPVPRPGVWRHVAAVGIGIATYVLAVFALIAAVTYAPRLLGIRGSGDLTAFGVELWIGWSGAILVSSVGVELMVYVFTGRWSNTVLLRLIAAGFATIFLTFLAKLPFRNYWSFFGILMPVGEALFCWLVGTQFARQKQGRSGENPPTPARYAGCL